MGEDYRSSLREHQSGAAFREARAVFDRVPTYAETLATVAHSMVDALPDPDLRPAYRKALRANAALERANALRQLGRLPDALTALTNAEESSEGEPECAHSRPRVAVPGERLVQDGPARGCRPVVEAVDQPVCCC